MCFTKKHSVVIILILLLSASVSFVEAQEWNRIYNMRGFWKFSIGDNAEWSTTNFNDKDWEEIYAPSSWEDEGFYGYNGYAWYRSKVKIKSRYKDQQLYLVMGYIDDVDEVYFNGTLIGFTGSFPPKFETAYDSFRRYPIPGDLIKYDSDNTVAVRVYDAQLDGGITSGDLGVYIFEYDIALQVDLSGLWKFHTRDDMQWKDADYNDSKWGNIVVPGYWEYQGYKGYDGLAWYRRTFRLPKVSPDEKYVLILGKIDDVDEVYLNGKLIGSTGDLESVMYTNQLDNYWQEFRGYYIPDNVLNKYGENTIAVRVYDGYRDGGIFEGPIGIVAQSDYSDFWKRRNKKNFWERLFGN